MRGVWQQESFTIDGEPGGAPGERQIKLVTDTHFAFVNQSPGPKTLSSPADTLAAFRTRFFGGGTYKVTPDTYTERVDFFMDSQYVGREIQFKCRVEGNLWYHEGEYPTIQDGVVTGSVHLSEVYRRIG